MDTERSEFSIKGEPASLFNTEMLEKSSEHAVSFEVNLKKTFLHATLPATNSHLRLQDVNLE